MQNLQLDQFLPYRLNRAAAAASRQLSVIYKRKYGLTVPEWRTLATLAEFGEMTAKQIGVHSAMHKTKVSRAVAELERRGWLIRQPDAEDRRAEHLTLTDAGSKAFRSLVPLAKEFQQRLHDGLGGSPADNLLSGLDALERFFSLPPHND